MERPDAPSGATVQKLVEALSSLQRLGDHRRHGLQIRIPEKESAWTMAFVKWLLGRPPNLEHGNRSLSQAGSQVIVVPWANRWHPDERLQITVHDEFDAIVDLVTADGRAQAFVGLVPVTTLGNSYVQYFGPRGSPRWLLALDMISYGCLVLLKRVRDAKDDCADCALPDDTVVNRAATYPLESDICETMAQFLGSESSNKLKDQRPVCSRNPKAMQQFDLDGLRSDGSDDLRYIMFVAKNCIATIFVLSLFAPNANLEPLLVVYETPEGASMLEFDALSNFLARRY